MIITREHHRPFGTTGLSVPPIMFGAGALGNACRVIPDQTKLAIVGEWFKHVVPPVMIEVAGKYGGGLALEMLGAALRRFDVGPEEIVICNQLGWLRQPSSGKEPAFVPGERESFEHVATRQVSYNGIRASWEQGCELLGPQHRPQLVSIHDVDEYLGEAASAADGERRFQNILEAYRALAELRAAGHVRGLGIAVKDWRIAEAIGAAVPLDWVMLTGCLTVLRHPPEVLAFVESLRERQTAIVLGATFQSGFLVGGNYYDQRLVQRESDADRPLMAWRKSFAALCEGHGVTPAHACVQFALSVPGVVAVALNTSHADRVAENVKSAITPVPASLWASLREEGLLAADSPHC